MIYKRLPTGMVVTEGEYNRIKRSRKMKIEKATATIAELMAAVKKNMKRREK